LQQQSLVEADLDALMLVFENILVNLNMTQPERARMRVVWFKKFPRKKTPLD